MSRHFEKNGHKIAARFASSPPPLYVAALYRSRHFHYRADAEMPTPPRPSAISRRSIFVAAIYACHAYAGRRRPPRFASLCIPSPERLPGYSFIASHLSAASSSSPQHIRRRRLRRIGFGRRYSTILTCCATPFLAPFSPAPADAYRLGQRRLAYSASCHLGHGSVTARFSLFYRHSPFHGLPMSYDYSHAGHASFRWLHDAGRAVELCRDARLFFAILRRRAYFLLLFRPACRRRLLAQLVFYADINMDLFKPRAESLLLQCRG